MPTYGSLAATTPRQAVRSGHIVSKLLCAQGLIYTVYRVSGLCTPDVFHSTTGGCSPADSMGIVPELLK